MRTTKTISVSMPPAQLKHMARTARKENRTMSELIRELYRRYVARQDFGEAVAALRAEAARTPAGRLTVRQFNTEIAAARRDRRRGQKPAR